MVKDELKGTDDLTEFYCSVSVPKDFIEASSLNVEISNNGNSSNEPTASGSSGFGEFRRSYSRQMSDSLQFVDFNEEFNQITPKTNSYDHLIDDPKSLPSDIMIGLHNKSNKSNDEKLNENLKTKLMSAWNNMRFEWAVKMKTNFKYDDPIFLLGSCYHCTMEGLDDYTISHKADTRTKSMEKFKHDFVSRLWFTYRKDFPELLKSGLSSDVGWGCMLRSGQMLIAQALVSYFLGPDWRAQRPQTHQEAAYHYQIIKLFLDNPHPSIPFSIHNLVRIGSLSGKQPGDWYGPSSVAYVFRDAMLSASTLDPMLSQLTIYVAQDCTVYISDVLDLCLTSSRSINDDQLSTFFTSNVKHKFLIKEKHWKPIIILIAVRLGGEDLNPIYIPCLKNVLANKMCLGIIGGKPKHSLYFVGWQDEKLIYLDPHFCQEAISNLGSGAFQSFHCRSPRKTAFTKIDPSCTLGFLIKTKQEFKEFIQEATKFSAPPKEKGIYPMFVFNQGRKRDCLSESNFTGIAETRKDYSDRPRTSINNRKFSDDFEVI